ncbi:alkaline phosphatase family protein [Sphingomonas crocodyli]|uniref:Alkaline phosphatase n=1 Tax=Sphingomonas crocodyli TaxID=1979270 RepID=A0A437MB90_9SPHN|nr:alkaline phosphatase family protein [Sphingomonas crocodyli]RVT94898.1 alkaline phosphatase family protein [Sphingomonas crocodyli]
MKKLGLLSALLASPAFAATPATVPPPTPKLIVAISVDQFSADLFAEYRQYYTGGLKTLTQGAVFPSGYQSHAATETCPGHSTILTGAHPAKTGIIANDWMDLSVARPDKTIYCSEDETVPGSSSEHYTVSPKHLLMPTLGDRMKAFNPASRVVSVAGKDRAALMMGGHVADQMWWWDRDHFVSFVGKAETPTVKAFNARIAAQLAKAGKPYTLPAICQTRVSAVPVSANRSVGVPIPARKAGDKAAWRVSPEYDQSTIDLASALVDEMKLGRGEAPDVISIGLSATDAVGHTFGTEGPESCGQVMHVDALLGTFFTKLNAAKIPYVVVLTADHGGHDLPERNQIHGLPSDTRVDPDKSPKVVDTAITQALKLDGVTVYGGGSFGDFYISKGLSDANRKRAIEATKTRLSADPQVGAVFTAEDFVGYKPTTMPVTEWTLLDRAAASYHPGRSGDLIVLLKPNVVPIPDPSRGSVATHGSPWDYDRRVPILFWWPNAHGFEQPNPVETVDILPTLAALIGLPITTPEIDGRCLDLDASAADSCKR